MAPGTEPGGDSVTIEHLADSTSVGTRMTDGGFDPVAIGAKAGDTLAISVLHGGGATDTTYGIVPVKGRPTIVRTSPAEGRTDVPLNCVIEIVFNEPMDSVSLTDALHLQLQGADVPGTVVWTSAGGGVLSGQFLPTDLLKPGSQYQLSVSNAVRDLAGNSLDGPVDISFATAGSSSEPLGAQISAISPTNAPAGSAELTLTITGTNFGGTLHNQSFVVWSANGRDTSLATTFVSSTQLSAVIPAALLSQPGTIQVFLYTGDPTGDLPLARSNSALFLVIAPPPPPGQSTIIVYGRLSSLGPKYKGYRDVSLDGSAWATLHEGGSVTYRPVAAGMHTLMLSNPCTGTHVPTTMYVTAVANESVTVSVYIPFNCE